MDRVGRDDHDWRDVRPRRLPLFEKRHRRKLDPNTSECREGREVDCVRDGRSGGGGSSGDGFGESLQSAGNRR